jgi:ATP synthase protein I
VSPSAHDQDPLARAARAALTQHERGIAEDRVPVGRSLAQLGMLGWLIVTPILAGLFSGRWLDQRLGTGIMLTGALLVLGAGLGGWLAWRRIRKE